MTRYPALLDGERGAYGVSFPDLPGIVAMGETVDEALVNAEEALRDYVIEAEGTGGAVEPPTPPDQFEYTGHGRSGAVDPGFGSLELFFETASPTEVERRLCNEVYVTGSRSRSGRPRMRQEGARR